MSRNPWRDGNRIELLENGEEFYPRVFAAIDQAQREVLVETFIVFEDRVGRVLQEKLVAAARRGVRVELTVDGYGSCDLSPAFVDALTQAGVGFHVYDPRPKLLGYYRTNLFRRLHRKLVIVDGRLGYIGGINFSADHLRDFGPEAKQDYAVEVEGPVVVDMRRLVEGTLAPTPPRRWWRRRALPGPEELARGSGEMSARVVGRDNFDHPDDIEREYREAIRCARREILIANAYFFPGYRLLRELRMAARRGVQVHLILQGNPDMHWVKWATETLYEYLLRQGVRIYEYCERPMHGKVAVIDDDWATVGSSNLDPLSLFLNLEANLIVSNPEFADQLRQRLRTIMANSCREITEQDMPHRTAWRQALSFLAFHAARRFPAIVGWLPGHAPRHAVAPPGTTPALEASPVTAKKELV